MVGNLTLEKMFVQPESYTDEQIVQLPSRLERRDPASAAPVLLHASYQLAGQKISRGSRVSIRHSGEFRCTICDRSTKKLFEGSCYPCFQTSPQADRCLLNPVGCHYVKGTCRDPRWGEEFCYQPHYVYLAHTDKLKVGITRRNQIPTRWIDQGATLAVLLAKVGSRHQAGLIEHLLSQKFADKSHWLKMLKAGNTRPNLADFELSRDSACAFLQAELFGPGGSTHRAPALDSTQGADAVELLPQASVVEINYPLWNPIPDKLTSLNLEKAPSIASEVLGIKGQYLFLSEGVLNIRRHEGYVVSCVLQGSSDRDCGAQSTPAD